MHPDDDLTDTTTGAMAIKDAAGRVVMSIPADEKPAPGTSRPIGEAYVDLSAEIRDIEAKILETEARLRANTPAAKALAILDELESVDFDDVSRLWDVVDRVRAELLEEPPTAPLIAPTTHALVRMDVRPSYTIAGDIVSAECTWRCTCGLTNRQWGTDSDAIQRSREAALADYMEHLRAAIGL